jgi:hypothetical protein
MCNVPKGKIRVEMTPKRIVSMSEKGKKKDIKEDMEKVSLWSDEGFED